MCGKKGSDDSTVGARHDAIGTNHTRCCRCLHARRRMSRYWTAQPAGSYRFLDHGNHVIKSQW